MTRRGWVAGFYWRNRRVIDAVFAWAMIATWVLAVAGFVLAALDMIL